MARDCFVQFQSILVYTVNLTLKSRNKLIIAMDAGLDLLTPGWSEILYDTLIWDLYNVLLVMSCLIKTVTKMAFLMFFFIAVAQMKRKIRKLYLDDTGLILPWTGRTFFCMYFSYLWEVLKMKAWMETVRFYNFVVY